MNATPEEWRPVVGYEGLYEVSDRGAVRSIDRVIARREHTVTYKGRLLKPRHMAPMGYETVGLSKNGRPRTIFVHVIVLEAFVGPRPDGMVSCHNNGDPNDNCPSNLRWDTQASNMRDRYMHAAALDEPPRRHRKPRKPTTQCRFGHEFTSDNTYVDPKGSKVCRQCKRARANVQNPRGPYGPRVTH